MIWESSYWKTELLEDIEQINSLLTLPQSKSAEGVEELFIRQNMQFEKFMFLSAYAVRKMLDANKLSDEIEKLQLPIKRYPRIASTLKIPHHANDPLDSFRAHRFEKYYAMDNPEENSMRIRTACNLLVHSFVFSPEQGNLEYAINGLFFNSDRTKKNWLFWLELKEWQSLLQQVVNDEIVDLHYNRMDGTMTKLSANVAEQRFKSH